MAKGLTLGEHKGMYAIFDSDGELVTRTMSLESAEEFVKRGGPVTSSLPMPTAKQGAKASATASEEGATEASETPMPRAQKVKPTKPRGRRGKKGAASF